MGEGMGAGDACSEMFLTLGPMLKEPVIIVWMHLGGRFLPIQNEVFESVDEGYTYESLAFNGKRSFGRLCNDKRY